MKGVGKSGGAVWMVQNVLIGRQGRSSWLDEAYVGTLSDRSLFLFDRKRKKLPIEGDVGGKLQLGL